MDEHGSQPLRVTVENRPSPVDVERIKDSVDEWNMALTGDRRYRSLTIFLRDDQNEVAGGLLGDMWGTWLHVTYLWIDEPYRHQGYGAYLIEQAEAEARAFGCTGIFLETFSFQARPFYERFGFHVLGVLPDYPPGHTYYYMSKRLEE